ncbi:hypothetical protein BaRGS_00026073 [Batillaria attramentaria]|uniref:Uncharacterized protein n=1 Tax=Batillaria attramentaria TaxID=370345 RepID=A0ABD0K5V4_9CAEN
MAVGKAQLPAARKRYGADVLSLPKCTPFQIRKSLGLIQQHSLAAMMGAIDGGEGDDFHGVPLDHNQSGLDPNRRDRQHRGRDASMRHALSELHNLQQQTSRGQSSTHRPVQERVVASTSAGPLHMSHLASSPSGADDRENIPPPVSGIPQFLRMPAEREQDGFRLPQIPVPAWGPERQPAPQPGIGGGAFRPPPPSYEQSSQLRPLSFGHIPPQVTTPRKDPLESSGGLISIPLLRLPQAGFPQTSQEPMFGRLVPPEYLSAEMEEKERQEAAKQRHLQGFHEQLAAQRMQAERDARAKAEQRKAAARSHRDEAEEMEEEIQRRHEKKVSAKRVAVKGKKEKAKPASPSPKPNAEPAEEEEQAVEEADKTESEDETENSEIHPGYAIPPGVFEGYEHLEKELGAEADSETRFQYKMAQAMRRQLEKEKERWLRQRKVDFATNTREHRDASVDVQRSFESIRTGEAATSVTKDTGVDPVHEAIAEYNRTRQGVAVPPDVFLGLHFADGEQGPSDEATRGRNRAFLNVVDVHASSVLRDIPERGQAEQGTDATAKPSYYSAQRTSAQDMGALEESLREQLEPAVVRRGHDSVTVRMFERRTPGDDRVSVALLPRSSVRDSKTALVQRLQAMNDQMAAMDEMSHNIESGLHNSKLLLDTLHSMNEVNQSVPDVSLQVPDVGRRSDEFLSARDIRRSADTLTPKVSAGSPAATARRSARSPAISDHSRRSDISRSGEVSHVSGVSGISDIIGEVLADGGVDLTAAGLTKEEADMLAARARYKRGPHSPRTSADELKQMVQAAEGAKSPEMKRREIHKWMTEKYAERQQEYLKNLSTLKEREHSPYKPSAPCRTLEEEREWRRKERARQFMIQRMLDAEYLIGSAMTDAIEQHPEFVRSRSPSPSSTSGARTRSPPRSPSRSPRRSLSRSPQRRERDRNASSDVTPQMARPMDKTFRVGSPPQPKGILKQTQSGSSIGPSASQTRQIQVQPTRESVEFDQTVESSSDLRDYMNAIQDMESSAEAEPKRKTRPRSVFTC